MVIEIVGILALVSVVVSYFKMRQAWQWWSDRQFLRLHEEAETIRDRLLQESFTMRRMLELSLLETPNSTLAGCLAQLNTLHQTLNALSDRLSPAYAQDDLSLAIAHLCKAWEIRSPNLTIELTLPTVWQQPAHKSDGLILEALDELLRILLPTVLTPTVIFVSLSFSDLHRELHLEIQCPKEPTLVISDLNYLSQTVRFLTRGHCSYSNDQQTLTWHYRQKRSAAFVPPTCKD